MATLVFAIKTIGEGWDTLDAESQRNLTYWADQVSTSDSERDTKISVIKKRLGSSALTGYTVSISVYDLERELGVVYYTGNGSGDEEEVGNYVFKERSESDMLEDFWEGAKNYDRFVTFNGRRFDVPFLNLRSAIHECKPTRNLMSGRYLSQQRGLLHIDLLDQLTYYGAVLRRPSLHMFCRAFGIQFSEFVSEHESLETLFHSEKYRDVAKQSMQTVVATTELYERWLTYLAPDSWSDEEIDLY